MAGILPVNGVPPQQTQNGILNPDLAGDCQNLYYGPRCNPRLDPFAMNAFISEFINALNAINQPYDCTRLDNLATAFLFLQADPPAVPAGAPAAVVQRLLASGQSDGTNPPANAWITRPMNVKTYDPGLIISLVGTGQFTPAVDVYCTWETQFQETERSKSRIRNLTDGNTAGIGTSTFAAEIGNETDGTAVSTGSAFLLAGKQYEMQVFCQHNAGTGPGNSLGRPSTTGEQELYASLRFWRIAV